MRLDVVATDVIANSGVWRVAVLALGQAAISTLVTLLIGLPLTFLIARYRFKGRSTLNVLLTLPFVMPTVVVALAFSSILPDSVRYGLLAVVLAHVYVNLAVVLRLVGGMLSQADRRYAQVAQTLGAHPLRAELSFTLRFATPAIVSAAAITFVFCFTSLGIVLLLGGREVPTLELEILRQATLLVNLDDAVALTLLQAFIVAFALGLSIWFQRRSVLPQSRPENAGRRPIVSRSNQAVLTLAVWVAAILLAMPLLALVVTSFSSESGFTLAWWQ